MPDGKVLGHLAVGYKLVAVQALTLLHCILYHVTELVLFKRQIRKIIKKLF